MFHFLVLHFVPEPQRGISDRRVEFFDETSQILKDYKRVVISLKDINNYLAIENP